GHAARRGANGPQRGGRGAKPIHAHDEGVEFEAIRPQRRPAELDHLEQGELARYAAQRQRRHGGRRAREARAIGSADAGAAAPARPAALAAARRRSIDAATAWIRTLSACTSMSSALPGFSSSCTPRLIPSPRTILHHGQMRKRYRMPGMGEMSGTIIAMGAGR